MGSTSSKFRKHLQNGDEVAALHLYNNNSDLRKGLDASSSYGDSHQHETPLHFAARFGMKSLLRVFLNEHGGNPNKTNTHNETALHCVCMESNAQFYMVKRRRLDCLNIILAWRGPSTRDVEVERVDLSAQDELKNTALHYAACSGLLSCVELLVQSASPLFIENDEGQTPCDSAEKHEHGKIALYLESKMVFSVLSEIVTWRDPTASSKARNFIHAISRHEFIIALLVLQRILAITKPLAETLQKVNKDLIKSLREVTVSVDVLKQKRTVVDEIMEDVILEAEDLLGEDITIPRTTGRQTHRSNVEASTPAQYYSRSILIPFLDGFITDIDDRFAKHNSTALLITALLPSYLNDYTFDDVKPIVDFLKPCCDFDVKTVQAEYERWNQKWKNVKKEEKPTCPAAAVLECDHDFYPCINAYLTIYCVIPTTTATAERTFSTLKYLKTYLRSTTGDKRLNGLTHMYLHRDMNIDIQQVIDKFAMKKRRCEFSV